MSKCEDMELLLPWLLNDTLEAREKNEAYAHVSSCDSCRRELVNLTALRQLWNDSGQQEDAERQNRLFNNMASLIAMERVEPEPYSAARPADIRQLNLLDQLHSLYRMELQKVRKRVSPAVQDLGKIGLFVRQVMLSAR